MNVLIVVGWILLGLVILLPLGLLPNLRLSFSSRDGEIKLSVHYLFLRYKILPMREKPPREKPSKKPKKKKLKSKKHPPKAEPKKEKHTTNELIEKYRPLVTEVRGTIRSLAGRVVVYKIKVRISVGGGDAHTTALKFAEVSSSAGIGVQLLGSLVKLRLGRQSIVITPDFLAPHSSSAIALKVRVRPIFLVIAGARLIPAYIRVVGKDRKTKRGGKKYESRAAPDK